MINKYNCITGGADTVFLQLCKLLEDKGHDVIKFCLNHSENLESKYSNYFVNGLTNENWGNASLLEKAKAYINGIYNLEAKRKIEILINERKPDIAHIHNIFYQISSSILTTLKKKNIPIIQTLHDYQAICANNNLYYKNMICKDCINRGYFNIIIKRCYDNSLAKSFLAFSVKNFNKIFKIYPEKIDLFLSPSKFVKNLFVSAGFKESKILVLNHMIDTTHYFPNYNFKGYIVFFGRLVPHKGVRTLIKALKNLPIRLLIIGKGEIEEEIRDYIKENNISNVEILGFLEGVKLHKVISNARFIVVPSEWYETWGLVITEAFALGKPVIASNIGAFPEIVSKDVGILFEPGNTEDLRRKIVKLFYDEKAIKELGINARKKVEKFYNAEKYYKKLIKIYRELI